MKQSIGEYPAARTFVINADAWQSWISYSWAFDALLIGFGEYFLAAADFVWGIPDVSRWVFRIAPFSGLLAAALQYVVFSNFSFEDQPWGAATQTLLGKKTGSPLPHDGVYARLAPSPIHGLGVFAIDDIPKGTYPFEPDDDDLRRIAASQTTSLQPEIRRLYDDFCPLNDGVYLAPKNFNQLGIAWYVNSSTNPNIEVDEELKFRTTRKIYKGEEITASYREYSENDPAQKSRP